MRRLFVGVAALMVAMTELLAVGGGAQAADSILTDVLRRGTVRIAISTGNPPTRFEDENGNLQGYDIDIANHLAKQLGVTIEFIRTDTAGRVAMLQTKKADITIASFTPNLERLKSVGFTDPYLTDVLTLMSRADRKDLASLADFDKPEVKDFTETVRLLAGLSHFVIVDITNPKSTPLELQATVPECMIPFVPILEKGEEPFAMFTDLWIKLRGWVLDPIRYPSVDRLVEVLDTKIVGPARAKFTELLAKKAEKLRVEDI